RNRAIQAALAAVEGRERKETIAVIALEQVLQIARGRPRRPFDVRAIARADAEGSGGIGHQLPEPDSAVVRASSHAPSTLDVRDPHELGWNPLLAEDLLDTNEVAARADERPGVDRTWLGKAGCHVDTLSGCPGLPPRRLLCAGHRDARVKEEHERERPHSDVE